jgi:hypothetical protein
MVDEMSAGAATSPFVGQNRVTIVMPLFAPVSNATRRPCQHDLPPGHRIVMGRDGREDAPCGAFVKFVSNASTRFHVNEMAAGLM